MTSQTPHTTPTEIIFYDGDCGLCHRSVLFVLRHDHAPARFQFAPQQGRTYLQNFGNVGIPPGSVVVLTHDRRRLLRSDATLYILQNLGGRWRLLGNILRLVPTPIRDWGYQLVAAFRRKLVKKPDGLCPLVPPQWRERFLP